MSKFMQLPDGILPPILQIVLSFLPVAFAGAPVLVAVFARGRLRVIGLVATPILGLVLMYPLGSAIAYNGNILGAVLAGLYGVFLYLYYPCLLIWAFVWALGSIFDEKFPPT
jgi:hypothetical protein